MTTYTCIQFGPPTDAPAPTGCFDFLRACCRTYPSQNVHGTHSATKLTESTVPEESIDQGAEAGGDDRVTASKGKIITDTGLGIGYTHAQ